MPQRGSLGGNSVVDPGPVVLVAGEKPTLVGRFCLTAVGVVHHGHIGSRVDGSLKVGPGGVGVA